MKLTTARVGILFALLAAFGYALLPIFTKYIYRYSNFTPIEIAGWRFLLAVPLMWALLYGRDRISYNPHAKERLPRLKLMGLGMILATAALSAFYGLEHVETGLYVMLFRTYPAMVLVMSMFLGEKIPLRGWGSLALVVLGVALLLFVPSDASLSFGALHKLGVAAAFYNALSVGVYNMGQQRVIANYHSKMRAAAWTITGSLSVLLPLTLYVGFPMFPNWQTLGGVLGLAFFCTILPVFAIYHSLSRIGASRYVLISSVEPLIALAWAWVLFGEALAGVQFIGAGLIIASIIVLESPALLQHARQEKSVPAITGD